MAVLRLLRAHNALTMLARDKKTTAMPASTVAVVMAAVVSIPNSVRVRVPVKGPARVLRAWPL